jgi:2-polyprenyl-6-hydroxyphenyl methylase/3-demethylubiquinone-9 3-methyltransferase
MSNVDSAEIKKFDAMAARWWDLQGDFRPLHDMNPVRVSYINEHSPVAGKKLLDVGCGGGILTEAMCKLKAEVTGIDMGETALSVATLHATDGKLEIDYRACTAEDLAAKEPGQYDIVCCLEMLEHVPDPGAVIQACADLTAEGGDLYFSTLNRNPKSFLFGVVGAEYVLGLLPKGTHDYKKFIRPHELAGWLRDANLDLVEIIGVTMNPFTRAFKLNPNDVSINYMVHARKS